MERKITAIRRVSRAEATADTARRLDQTAIRMGVSAVQMMELASYHIGQFCLDRFSGKRIGVVAGGGNNGADALSSARFMVNGGLSVEIVLAEPAGKLSPLGKQHLSVLKKMGVRVRTYSSKGIFSYDVIVDGLIGYSLKGNPKGVYSDCIRAINASSAIIVSVDVPSGYDANSGAALNPCVRADATLFLASPKAGYTLKRNKGFFGECYLVDIGVPVNAYRVSGVAYPFAQPQIR